MGGVAVVDAKMEQNIQTTIQSRYSVSLRQMLCWGGRLRRCGPCALLGNADAVLIDPAAAHKHQIWRRLRLLDLAHLVGVCGDSPENPRQVSYRGLSHRGLMASNFNPLSPRENGETRLPIPPPPLLTRSSNDYFDQPTTPTRHGFASPQQTPQGSPSKNVVPPGAYDLPNVFDKAMKLQPTIGTPTRNGRQQVAETSPQRNSVLVADGRYEVEYPDYGQAAMPGSPTRKSNKENTPPGSRPVLKKESSFLNHAAQSRENVYRTKEATESKTQYVQRGLSADDVEKLQKPSIKRLSNVTQLCKAGSFVVIIRKLTFLRLPRLLL